MLPIAILPVAGLLLGVGGSLTNETMLKAYGCDEMGKILHMQLHENELGYLAMHIQRCIEEIESETKEQL